MRRFSGPRGAEIYNQSKEFVKLFHDKVYNQITSQPKNERWLWANEIIDEFNRMVNVMCYQLDDDDPRF